MTRTAAANQARLERLDREVNGVVPPIRLHREGLVLESDAELDWSGLGLKPVFKLVLRIERNVVVLSGVEVLVGKMHIGVVALHWGWHLAIASPVPAQLHVPVVPHPSTVPGSGSHGQQLEQHQAHSGLSQPQPLAHPRRASPPKRIS